VGEDKKSTEEEKFIKDQGKKILDLLVKIGPVSNGLKELYKVSRETEKALTMVSTTLETGQLSASDGNMNRLATIARRFLNELSTLNRFDENWWIEASGANLFSVGDSTKAIGILEQQRQHLVDLKAACDGLRTLAAVAYANTYADIKGLAKMYMPSIAALDGIVTKETREGFDNCMKLIDSIVKKVEAALRAVADMNKVVDRFLVLKNSQDQKEALKAIKQGQQQNLSTTQ
jgi:hypothetical protein